MIIDRAAGVTPTRFVDRGLRKEIGRLIGAASRDTMLRAFLWVSECQIAQEICEEWEAHASQLDRELRDAVERQAATVAPSYSWIADSRDQITKGCHEASSALVVKLEDESAEARQAHQECTQVLFELSCQLGQRGTQTLPVADSCGTPLLDTLGPLREQLDASRKRFAALVAQDREELHELAILEESRQRSADRGSSVSLHRIDASPSSEFVDLVKSLLERDGFQTRCPGGVGSEVLVLATCREGHTSLVRVHHVRGTEGWKPEPTEMSTPKLHAALLVAKQHGADDVTVVTNRDFSRPARRYADEHDMSLLDRNDLQRWAVWGQSMICSDDLEEDVA
ncbi:restriction endonuclease [Streptomyces chryseus]|uniref:restriction endonuclease n=1 Tax=Streptomyces chryseus TaxID=68186 RepID=UPI00110FC70C|nr:restriction endonuclease [Streptomyces chryseus]